MRVCIVYDCLYPHTIGGAERWYRGLAERLAGAGHEVTYVTLRQWEVGEEPTVAGVRIVRAGPRMALYAGPGRRRVLPPLIFGAGVLAHLLRHGRDYDVVHTASFPYFSVLAAALAAPLGGFRLLVDWHEVWTRAYWREYLGPLAGDVGWGVQRLCARVPQRAFCFSRRHARRLVREGHRGEVTRLEGEYAGPLDARPSGRVEPLVVAAARQIPEKRIPALVPALALARREAPELRGLILGDGPEHERVRRAIEQHALSDAVAAPGFVSAADVDAAFGRALCMVLPSRREGYGQVVIEAAARGTPSIVVEDEDNAAVELVEQGVNGFVAASAEPAELAAAILRARAGGAELRARTLAWFTANAARLSLDSSIAIVVAAYAAVEPPTARRRRRRPGGRGATTASA